MIFERRSKPLDRLTNPSNGGKHYLPYPLNTVLSGDVSSSIESR